MIPNDPFLATVDPEVLTRVRMSRREALSKATRAGVGAAVLTSLPVAFGLSAQQAFGQTVPAAIAAVLNYALTLEYLEDEFYRLGLQSGVVPAGTARTVFQTISTHEAQHVALLKSVLGSQAVAKPTFDFTAGNGANNGPFRPFSDYQTFLALSQGFEDTGVRAYKGRAPELKGTDTLTVALQIHAVEARHASRVRQLRGQKGWIVGNQTDVAALQAIYNGEETVNGSAAGVPALSITEAYDELLTPAQVLAIVDPFIAG